VLGVIGEPDAQGLESAKGIGGSLRCILGLPWPRDGGSQRRRGRANQARVCIAHLIITPKSTVILSYSRVGPPGLVITAYYRSLTNDPTISYWEGDRYLLNTAVMRSVPHRPHISLVPFLSKPLLLHHWPSCHNCYCQSANGEDELCLVKRLV